MTVLTQQVPASQTEAAATKQAVEAANAWLAPVDHGKVAESWDTAAQYFKDAAGKEPWSKSIKAVREPLGAVKSRKVKNTEYRTKMPAPPTASTW